MFYEVIIIPLNFQPETGTVYRVEAIWLTDSDRIWIQSCLLENQFM
jgi:hypothetical protein